MKFTQQTVNVTTKVNKDAPAVTTALTLTESEIDDSIIMAALISGQSPRVRIQNAWRDDGIPKEVTIPWATYITPGKVTKVHVPFKPTPENVGTLSNEVKLEMLKLLRAEFEANKDLDTK